MSASPAKTPQVLDPEQVVRGLHPLMMKGSLTLSAAITLQFVGEWRTMAWVFTLNAVRILANILLSRLTHRWLSQAATEWIRMLINVSCLAATGVVTGWSLLLWIYVPFAMLWIYGGVRGGGAAGDAGGDQAGERDRVGPEALRAGRRGGAHRV